MSILTVSNLTHGFGDRAIFDNISFRLLKGEHIGLIGANGEGKSTFINIITHQLQPDEGTIQWSRNIRVGHLDQHTVLEPGQTIKDVLDSAFAYLFVLEKEMLALYEAMAELTDEQLDAAMERVGEIQDLLNTNDFYMVDAKVSEVAQALGLADLGMDRDVSDLSGGQRTKALIGKLLLEKPDILLLDEPTNYLDEDHIIWLTRYLQEYENAFVLISHDMPFLNSVINLIYHVENKALTRYVGDYNSFLTVHEARKQQLESASKRQQKEIESLKEFVAKNKARYSTRNMAMSRQKKLDKMEIIEIAKDKPKPVFRFREARTPSKLIFETNDLVIGYDAPLSRSLNLSMERRQKIALTGANGIGKTTLLKSMMGLISPLSGTVDQGEFLSQGYFEQEIKADNPNTCIEEMWEEYPGWNQGEIRAALAGCGLTTQHIESRVMVLSGGEQAKLRLCKLINRETNLLLLDEPTNHLDVDAKAALKEALKAYGGSIVLICHEPEFYQDIVSDVWNCEEWTTKLI